jgi:branched-chain amino acid transport system ATP-binding protein
MTAVGEGGPRALEIRDVSLSFGGLSALSNVSLTVRTGENVGLVGANGSGKTSLLNCISGIYQPQQGQIYIGDTLGSGLAPHRIAALGVGRTLQSVEAVRDVPLLWYVMLGRHQRQQGRVLRYLSGWPALGGAEARERTAAMEQLESMGLSGFASMRMSAVPYGIAKLADLARVLLGEPRLVLLDEPASGLNTDERAQIAEVLRDIGRAPDRALVVVEHDLTLAARVCDTMLVLGAGKRLAYGKPREVLANPDVVDQLLGGAPLKDPLPAPGPEPGEGRPASAEGAAPAHKENPS